MPLTKGNSPKVISKNIAEFHSGKTYAKTKAKYGKQRANAQAVAVALNTARNRAFGGPVGGAFPGVMPPDGQSGIPQGMPSGIASPQMPMGPPQMMPQQQMPSGPPPMPPNGQMPPTGMANLPPPPSNMVQMPTGAPQQLPPMNGPMNGQMNGPMSGQPAGIAPPMSFAQGQAMPFNPGQSMQFNPGQVMQPPASMAGASQLPINRAFGGAGMVKTPSMTPTWQERQQARNMTRGPILSSVPGRTDAHATHVPSSSYVIPADIVSGRGQGNTMAGADSLQRLFHMGPYGSSLSHIKPGKMPSAIKPPKFMKRSGGSVDSHVGKPVRVNLAGGEMVIPPEHLIAHVHPNLKHAHAIMDAWVLHERKKLRKTLAKLPGPVKD